MNTWIVVADRASARILSRGVTGDEYAVVECLIHPESQEKLGDLVSDRQGRFPHGGGGRHAAEPHHDFPHLCAERFAAEIVDYLEPRRHRREFDRLILIAPPLLLGALRSKLTSSLEQMVVVTSDKDLASLPQKELEDRITGLIDEYASAV
jgi:protein required for attachment to host cells